MRDETKNARGSKDEGLMGVLDALAADTPMIDEDATLDSFELPAGVADDATDGQDKDDSDSLPIPAAAPITPEKRPSAPVGSLSDDHRSMTIAEACSDDAEMAAFCERLGIDPDDPHPGHEALVLVRAIFESASSLRGVVAEEGDLLLEAVKSGTENRKITAEILTDAAANLRDAANSCAETRLALDASSAAAVSMLKECSAEVSSRASKAVAAAAAKACASIPVAARSELEKASDAVISGYEAVSEKTGDRLRLAVSSGAQNAAAAVSRVISNEAPKVAEAVTRGILAAESKRVASDPWRWHKVAVVGATLVVCMILAFVGGREMGRAHAEPPAVVSGR